MYREGDNQMNQTIKAIGLEICSKISWSKFFNNLPVLGEKSINNRSDTRTCSLSKSRFSSMAESWSLSNSDSRGNSSVSSSGLWNCSIFRFRQE